MINPLRTAVIAAMIAFMPGFASAASGVEISNIYSYAVPSGARSAAAFMTITYPSAEGEMTPDRLIKVETPVAGKAEIHTLLIENDMMMMRSVDVFPLPPGGSISFSPQGPHIMMMELRQPLVVGEKFPMTLVFEKAGSVEIEVPVYAPGTGPAISTDVAADAAASPAVISAPEPAAGAADPMAGHQH